MIELTNEAAGEMLRRYRGFHDARYLDVQIHPPDANTDAFSCVVAILAKCSRDDRAYEVVFRIDGVKEFQVKYDRTFDYPNVRDDIAIKNLGGLVYFDFGGAGVEPTSAEEFRRSDNYFVGTEIYVSERLAESDLLQRFGY